jgi:hypothetical protein
VYATTYSQLDYKELHQASKLLQLSQKRASPQVPEQALQNKIAGSIRTTMPQVTLKNKIPVKCGTGKWVDRKE